VLYIILEILNFINIDMIKHKHHIIPRHAGGSDDPSNLIELTIEEHAEAHRILYEQHGRQEDKWAWLGLSGQIGKDEMLREIAMSQKGKKKPEGFGAKISAFRKTFKYSEESKKKIGASNRGKIRTPEQIEKIRQSRLGKKQSEHQKQVVAEMRQKSYKITDPNGKEFVITNLSKFCRENNLDQGNMCSNRTKGWTCIKVI
jgi:hypothetical protein